MSLSLIALSTVTLTTTACTQDTEQDDEIGLRVSAAVQVLPEIAGVEFRLTPAMCRPGDVVPEDDFVYGIDITMMAMPDGSKFDAADDYDASMIAESFMAVPAGCYTFIATPIGADDQPLANCTTEPRDVVVSEGVAADLDLVIECGDDPREQAEVNQPPTIDSFVIAEPVSACEATRICATASDPDFDMLDFTWDLSSLGISPTATAVVSHRIDENRAVTQCIVVQARESGSYDIGLTVHDVTRFTDATGRLGEPTRIEDELGFESHAADTVTLDATLGCEATGRSAVVMLTLDNDPGMSKPDASQLIGNLIEWAGPVDASAPARVLVVLDDAHHGEDAGDANYVATLMEAQGIDVTTQHEPDEGLVWSELQAFDVVWFVNPGHPMDDPQTHTALLRYRNAGGGLILQGDDMAHFWGAPDYMQPLTYLDWDNNGTVSCGRTTDNNQGANYIVEFNSGNHPILRGLEGMNFEYGNDIDHSVPLGKGENVLAWGYVKRTGCQVKTPVVVALEPDELLAWGG
ncbi:hypothetical protein ACNOYE_32350 [Nannocystaceae bacterium ST9]